VSLGKYQTTFYNKSGSAFQSSVVGGVVTIIAVLIVGFIIVEQLISVFSRAHHNLDIDGEIIEAYTCDPTTGLITEKIAQCDGDCTKVYVKDLPRLLAPDFRLVVDYYE